MLFFFKRIEQFYCAVTANLSQNERDFVAQYLSISERKLFYGMAIFDQYHAYRVAKTAERLAREKHYGKASQRILLKLGLLHDIGRLAGEVTIGDKVLAVLLPASLIKRLARKGQGGFWKNRCHALYVYRYHALIGAKRLCAQGAKRFAYIIAAHHNCQRTQKRNDFLYLLQMADREN